MTRLTRRTKTPRPRRKRPNPTPARRKGTARMAKREHPRNENTQWPDYDFHEYPMMVYPGSPEGRNAPHPRPPAHSGKEPGGVQNEEERRRPLHIDEPVEAEPKRQRKRNLVPGP